MRVGCRPGAAADLEEIYRFVFERSVSAATALKFVKRRLAERSRLQADLLAGSRHMMEGVMAKLTGRTLNMEWRIGAQHALYREDGTWYHVLTRFPGALCDAHGYVLFESEKEYRGCPGLIIGKDRNWANAPAGISTLAAYVRVK